MPLDPIEFPADDLARARRFWETLLDDQREAKAQGLQTHEDRPSLGLHDRGRGLVIAPRCRTSAPRISRGHSRAAVELEASVVHPGERWAIWRDSEGSPFGLTEA